MHGRNFEKLAHKEELLNAIAENNSSPKVASFQADLSIFDEVNQLINDINHKHNTLDVIINNAGVFKTSQPIARNGMDVRYVVNTLSPYLLSKGLMPLLAEDGRVINLSSAAQAPINLKALAGDVQVNDDFQAYAQSKLAITIWSQELAKELKSNQIIIAVNLGSLLVSKMVEEGFGMAGNDISIGADILVRAALSENS
ncbi:SDR family NAD(P)-dependent oxidoreductase [Colwellia sp. RSH04]|uniref:SDR family NAD(P)-dependent oxidoreductase n=1 Tax=Colwellia sp. RSH04 TaxID=2305464 RepID=UPI002174E7CC|nr:SDR family NAD(P)-dependent oxidoreductase [Colwellia sp. RSH04]